MATRHLPAAGLLRWQACQLVATLGPYPRSFEGVIFGCGGFAVATPPPAKMSKHSDRLRDPVGVVSDEDFAASRCALRCSVCLVLYHRSVAVARSLRSGDMTTRCDSLSFITSRCDSLSFIIVDHRHIARDHSLTCGGGEDAQRPEPEPRRVCQPSRVTEILRHFVSRQMRILAATAWSCVTTIARASRCAEGTMGGCRLDPVPQNTPKLAENHIPPERSPFRPNRPKTPKTPENGHFGPFSPYILLTPLRPNTNY